MSLVSYDSIHQCHNEVTNEPKNDTLEKKNTWKNASERGDGNREKQNFSKNKVLYVNNFNLEDVNDVFVENYDIYEEVISTNDEIESKEKRSLDNDLDIIANTRHLESSKERRYEKAEYNCTKLIQGKTCNKNFVHNFIDNKKSLKGTKDILTKRDDNINLFSNEINVAKSVIKKKAWQKQIKKPIWMKTDGRINKKYRKKLRCRLNSKLLITLILLNVAGQCCAIDASSFSSGLTSRMIASFLGYPSTCTLGSEVRPCSLTISCWLRGGTRLRSCGGWLFSCCGLAESSSDTQANSIPSSDWKYKPSPPMLRQVPQRSGMPNNVFRRRVDDDATQMDCGLPSSRILQKRIIGGREARFAEFPWQAHVRISEFQCGGVLVSRRYVATAAHCVSRAHTRDIAVWLGAIDTSATHHPARKLGVIQKILHPLFQFRMTQPDRYDIALLKLSRPITYMSHILPICLPDHDLDLRGRSGVIAGWGKTDASNGHTGTNLLRSATVPILSKEQCINWHQIKQISVEIHSEMICAGHSDGHQDACLGDSGGPLIVLDNGRYYLVGITSAGFGCGVDHQPGIYHNVKLTANWIRGVISPSMNYNDNYLNQI